MRAAPGDGISCSLTELGAGPHRVGGLRSTAVAFAGTLTLGLRWASSVGSHGTSHLLIE
jgi:hypothetical protein